MQSKMQAKLQFQPVSFSWLALHPEPKGVIQFIGGAGFGSLPTVAYRYFLQRLFDAGYTIVALPFRFSFRHWSIALSLLAEQQKLKSILAELAKQMGYQHEIYQSAEQYYWVGHSLGCKYVVLLELLSGEWREDVKHCTTKGTAAWLADRLPLERAIRGQRSLLIAPDLSDTETAIPIKSIARILDRFGWGVRPNQRQTKCLISRTQLFNLTAMISFDRDRVAGSIKDPPNTDSDVQWLYEQLQQHLVIQQELAGKHLEPVGIKIGNFIVDLNPLDKFIQPLSARSLEETVLTFLEKLENSHP